MSNRLTGEYEAVLQISGGTFDRLLATMHQNGFADPSKPSFPHVTHFRLEDDRVEGGLRGSLSAQIGVPNLGLIDGATDRFRIEFGLRARYRADPGSRQLADVIHGTVRAEYRFRDIDERCWGWQGIADEYLWMRVVEDSVSFEGIVHDESSGLAVIGVLDEEKVKALVTKQLAGLLATRFQPTPQPIGKRFRHGVRCLAFGPGPDQSAVAIPLGLSSEIPVGDPESMQEPFLGRRDFGLAVSSDYVTARMQSQLVPMVGLRRDLHVHGDAGLAGGLEVDYHVRLDSIEARWLGPLSTPSPQPGQGLIRARFGGSGWATRLYKSGVFEIGSVTLDDLKMTFSGEQLLMLSFDPSGERVTISAFGPPSVSVFYGGPFGNEMRPRAQDEIAAHIQANLIGALGRAQQQLNVLTGPSPKSPLIDQLRRIDAAASARFDEAVFRNDGLILRGVIGVARRHVPHVEFEKTAAGDGFDAIESWIPGGRVDSFEWSWRWFTNPIQGPPGPAGSEDVKHTFLLRRPHGGKTKFGMWLFEDKPLPGLDGSGRVCLTIRGARVDANTGVLVPVESVTECQQFGYEFHMPIEVAPWLPICDPLLGPPEGPFPEIGILQVGPTVIRQPSFNILILVLQFWDVELVSVLTAGLDACRRVNAGLLVHMLFPEGFFAGVGPEIGAQLTALAQRLEAPLLASEDVRNGWSTALGLPAELNQPSWRLIAPDGVLTWTAEGFPDVKELGEILDVRLVESAAAGFVGIRPEVAIGHPLPIDLVVPPCPPVPLSRSGLGGSKLVFVQKDHSSSLVQLERLGREELDREPGDLFVAAVVAGADVGEAERLHAELKLGFPVFPDPDGAITRRAGVRFWPTMLTLDDLGRLAHFAMGLSVEGRRS